MLWYHFEFVSIKNSIRGPSNRLFYGITKTRLKWHVKCVYSKGYAAEFRKQFVRSIAQCILYPQHAQSTNELLMILYRNSFLILWHRKTSVWKPNFITMFYRFPLQLRHITKEFLSGVVGNYSHSVQQHWNKLLNNQRKW